jgi:hypothetical protein
MMNLVDLQDKLKSFSEEQLIGEMQMPTGQLPQFLVLSEITRRQKMRDSFEGQQGQEQTTVAQDAIAAAGMPSEFAGQMAGAMAPQTDMMGNTGAMPQQEMMPEQGMPPMPVQVMAGGGIVALQQGSVGRGAISGGQPRLVVSGGRQFIEMPDGSLIPAEALGMPGVSDDILAGRNIGVGEQPDRFPTMPEPFAPALSGAGDSAPTISSVPSAEMPGRAPPLVPIFDAENQMRGVNPSFAESQFYRGDTFPGEAALPLTGLTEPQGPRQATFAQDPESVQQAQDDLFRIIGGVITPPLQALDQSAIGQYRTPSMTSMLPQFMQDRIAGADVGGMPEYFGAAGEGFPVSDSISGAPAVADATSLRHSGPGMAERHKSGQSGPIELGDRRLPSLPPSSRVSIDDFAENFGQDPASNIATIGRQPGIGERMFGADALRAAGLRTAEDRIAEAEAARTQTTGTPLQIPEDPIDLLPPRADGTRVTADPTPTTDPRGPGAGGIASMVGGAAGVAPTNFQQELMDMLAAREKRAEQDKWLALAQFGLGLMGSDKLSLGEAIGEAGAPALEALRTGRETAEADRLGLLSAIEQSRMGEAQLQLKRQAAAARGAAGSGLGLGAGENRFINQLKNIVDMNKDRLDSLIPPGMAPQQAINAARDANDNQRVMAIADAMRDYEQSFRQFQSALQQGATSGVADPDSLDLTRGE